MKKIKWLVKDRENNVLSESNTRHWARDSKKWYEENVFAEWMDDVKFPVRIIREEWELIGEKVVR